MDGQVKYRIGIGATIALMVFAFICDLVGLIPLAKDFTATLFWLVAGGYLMIFAKVDMFKASKLATSAASWLISLIPVLQEVPIELLAGIIAVIWMTRREDRMAAKAQIPTGNNVDGRRNAPTRTPLYVDGRRVPQNQQIEEEADEDTEENEAIRA